MHIREIATDLDLPEGPVAMQDGSIIVVEVAGRRVTRVRPDGSKHTIANTDGGPNGLAIGPDGALYLCNNGQDYEMARRPGAAMPRIKLVRSTPGRIERINISTGKVEVLYDSCDGIKLIAPNDIVFDDQGGFWFTDFGKTTDDSILYGSLCYARADGSQITRVRRHLISPNGVGLSPDGKTVYYAETTPCRLWAVDLVSPGVAQKPGEHASARFIGTFPHGLAHFDSLGVQADGGVCCATIIAGGITTFGPDEGKIAHTALPDPFITNICWGGDDMKTAFITSAGHSKLLAVDWPTPGLRLAYNA